MPTHGAEQRRERGDDEDLARADDDPREDVAPEPVGAEEVVARRGAELVEDVVGLRVVRRDQVAEERADDPEADEERSR